MNNKFLGDNVHEVRVIDTESGEKFRVNVDHITKNGTIHTESIFGALFRLNGMCLNSPFLQLLPKIPEGSKSAWLNRRTNNTPRGLEGDDIAKAIEKNPAKYFGGKLIDLQREFRVFLSGLSTRPDVGIEYQNNTIRLVESAVSITTTYIARILYNRMQLSKVYKGKILMSLCAYNITNEHRKACDSAGIDWMEIDKNNFSIITESFRDNLK